MIPSIHHFLTITFPLKPIYVEPLARALDRCALALCYTISSYTRHLLLLQRRIHLLSLERSLGPGARCGLAVFLSRIIDAFLRVQLCSQLVYLKPESRSHVQERDTREVGETSATLPAVGQKSLDEERDWSWAETDGTGELSKPSCLFLRLSFDLI